MQFGAVEILLTVVLLLLWIYYLLTNTFNFWRERKIPGPRPIPVFGSIKDVITGKFSIGTYLEYLYKTYPNEPMIGIFLRKTPALILNDLDLIKTVLIKDFKSFANRGLKVNEKFEPLSAHLFFMEERRWRPLRSKLTPIFSSGKLKEMFYLIAECADKLDKHLDTYNEKNVDVRDICARFTTDVIGLCAFGLDANALEDKNSVFRQMGKRIFNFNLRAVLRLRISRFAPALYNIIGGWLTDHVVTNFFINLTKDTIEYRKKNNIKRHDFVDLLSALRDENKKIAEFELTDSLLAAQLFVFFVAGFETSSTTMSNCLLELALHHDIQDKVRQEIKEEMTKTDGNITYEMIKNMKYLDKVFNETLRKYPPGMLIMRKTTEQYTFPNTTLSIPIDTLVWIPIYAIQRDPKYYPNPEIFDPERFTSEEIAKRHPMTFLPFGDGPRNCIGLRFAHIQTKVGLVKVLQNHTVDICKETDKEYTLDNRSFLLTPRNGIILKIQKL